VTSERLAGVRVRKVHLDERNAHGEQCVAQRHARVSQATRIQDQEVELLLSRVVNAIDELVLGVALERRELMAGFAGDAPP
jgi:hypothetical protein